MKIVFVADNVDGEKSGGVVSTRRFIDYFKKTDDLTIVSTGEAEENKIVFPDFYLPFAKKQMQEMDFLFAWPNKKVLRAVIKDADLVHIQFPFFLGYQALKIARKMNKPVVFGFHVQPENLMWNIGLNYEWLNAFLYRFFITVFYNKADLIMSPSIFGRQMLEKFSIQVPVEIISNGLPEQFRPKHCVKDPEFADKFVILMVGRLAKEKRHDLVMQAIKQSKFKEKIQLVVTGQGALRAELIDLGNTLPNPAFFEYVSQEKLISLFNTADLFIHASEIELEGMAVLEAIGCGLPALISDAEHSASAQFALNDDFLFSAGDSASLVCKLDYWIEHEAELKASKSAYVEKAQTYAFDASVQHARLLYQGLVDSKANK
ncbi:glycosyltransferase [Methyloprofundus sedimenti]|uniref:glycosyltransferase n=1 Tax=Methyloprofundus sedimenti TaxID=1420851 RepID=UPI001301EE50|nr:glycosyltransferase [Methyloprofundus sedimenti]